MTASITTASNVIIVGTSIIVPVDIQSSAIAYDTFNNAWIVEGTMEANIQNGTLYVDVVNTPTVLATIEGQPISVTVSNTPTVLATIEGQPISVNVTGGTVNSVKQPDATLLGQVVRGSITANANIFSSNLSITQPSRILTVAAASASGTLSLALTVGTTTVQNHFNSGNALNASSWYEFAIDLPSGVQINYQYTSSTTITILVLSEPL